jgi:protein transport protein SEC24
VGAVQSGMLHVIAKTIHDNLEKIPNIDERTKIGIITFDSTIHFYNLNVNVFLTQASMLEPQMLVLPDLNETFIPLPYDLLVPLSDGASILKTLLKKLPIIFKDNNNTSSALGMALKIGEKLIVKQSNHRALWEAKL